MLVHDTKAKLTSKDEKVLSKNDVPAWLYTYSNAAGKVVELYLKDILYLFKMKVKILKI